MRVARFVVIVAVIAALSAVTSRASAAELHPRKRIFVLMVWDGLRPDMVTQRETPNLFALQREGVRFDRQHAQYPTDTMVNAAALATGAPPSIAGIFGDTMYLGPALKAAGGPSKAILPDDVRNRPVVLEDSKLLAALNGPGAFGGRLLGIETVAQEILREGGYLAVVGKRGPTFMFDDRIASPAAARRLAAEQHGAPLFLCDDLAGPGAAEKKLLAAMPPASHEGVSDGERDAYFAKVAAQQAIPAAKQAAEHGHPALIVLWLHNPDLTQHRAGLGTLPAIEALTSADRDLAVVRGALIAAGIANRADLMVVSDHGFATIRLRLSLSALLVGAGLKKSASSSDVIIAPNGGSDLVYLSRADFKTPEERHERLQKIVNFCEAQEWCGPIFSRRPAPVVPTRHHHRRRAQAYLGWIDGTFLQSAVGLFNADRSPDLIISFGEDPDLDNRRFTGPGEPAFALGAKGQESVPNHSSPLVHPVKGLVYADTGPGNSWTTGMGMHGAAGSREIHNFCAAVGPDFRQRYVDRDPSGDIDIAPTIERVLGLEPNVGPSGVYAAGRVLTEALAGGRTAVGVPRAISMRSDLVLQGVEAITTLHLTRLDDRLYLDGSSVDRKPLGSSP
jgi:Type I phosphodiesterase / nucleotide pyrophosphatase